MPQVKSPLTRQQYDELKKQERLLQETLELVDRAEACGIECQQYRSVLDSLRDRLQQYERNFFTPIPK